MKLEIDTACCPLEPIIAAVMQHGHIVDMTITDPPMEEIIAMMYRQTAPEHAVSLVQADEQPLEASF
ncbi:MAG: hypothetical protein ACRDHZ_25805 [Ktedonobacteraceae bacterium]